MNIAMIFAGGTGQRMRTVSKPKQFLELHGRPIIAYTLDVFENHTEIDAIVVVCLESWIPHLKKVVAREGYTKVASIVPGGSNGQESIYNGLQEVHRLFHDDDYVLIHDGVRPLVDEETITRNVACAKQNGNSITVTPAIETIVQKDESDGITSILERSKCFLAKAPQTFLLKDILNFHNRAIQENNHSFIDSASMAKYYGAKLFTIDGNIENIKVTTPTDFYILRAIIDARENSEIFG